MIESGNLFADIPEALENEQFLDLFSAPGVKIERIVSTGHATPASEWLDQDWTECVALLAGAAAIQIEGEPSVRTLEPGDWLLIPRICAIGSNGPIRPARLSGWRSTSVSRIGP